VLELIFLLLYIFLFAPPAQILIITVALTIIFFCFCLLYNLREYLRHSENPLFGCGETTANKI